jgi:triacylglycerol lipase
VIAGSRVVSPLGWWLMRAPSDGTVSVERTRVAGMHDHIVLPHSHTFIMDAPRVADEAVHFLRHGRFTPDAPRRL